jgi:methyltransferase, FkbM family
MKFVDGWWVPDMMDAAGTYVARAKELNKQVERVKNKKVVVQAGGHIGIVPHYLSKSFETVYTFEPEIENFRCLVRNAINSNVFAARAALGGKRGCVGLRIHSKSTGGHSIGGSGNVPSYRIDDLALPVCDAIFLDVEGYEIRALFGASNTIERLHPLIVAEENKKTHNQGNEFGDMEKMLAEYGYRVVDRCGEDIVFEYQPKA